MHKKPLNFDLLLSYDAIKALSGVLIMQTGTVKFQEEAFMCARLTNWTSVLGLSHGSCWATVNWPSYKIA